MSISLLFPSLKQLYECELWSDVIYLGNLMLTACQRSRSALSALDRYQTKVYVANSHYELDQWKQATHEYYIALNAFKSSKIHHLIDNEPPEVQLDYTSEEELRFSLYKSLMRQLSYEEAMGVLEAIPQEQRSPKVCIALARIYSRNGRVCLDKKTHPGAAGENYKMLFQQVPMALQSITEFANWMSCGIHPTSIGLTNRNLNEHQQNVANSQQAIESVLRVAVGDANVSQLPWLRAWTDVQLCIANNDYAKAAQLLREICSHSDVANDRRLLIELGLLFNHCGQHDKAIVTLQKARSLDVLNVYGMDSLAALLYREHKKRKSELEALALNMSRLNGQTAEVLTAFSYMSLMKGDKDTALHTANKAALMAENLMTATKHALVQALLAKATVLIQLKMKPLHCGKHLTEAMMLDVSNIDAYEAVVNYKLDRGEIKDALGYCKQCRDCLGTHSPRALTLTAKVLERDKVTLPQAQSMLETAVRNASYLLEAVAVYDRQNQYDKAIQLLRQQTSMHVNSRLHRLLGDLLSKTNRAMEASDEYKNALTLDPCSPDANDGLASLDMMAPGMFEPMLAAWVNSPSPSGTGAVGGSGLQPADENQYSSTSFSGAGPPVTPMDTHDGNGVLEEVGVGVDDSLEDGSDNFDNLDLMDDNGEMLGTTDSARNAAAGHTSGGGARRTNTTANPIPGAPRRVTRRTAAAIAAQQLSPPSTIRFDESSDS